MHVRPNADDRDPKRRHYNLSGVFILQIVPGKLGVLPDYYRDTRLVSVVGCAAANRATAI